MTVILNPNHLNNYTDIYTKSKVTKVKFLVFKLLSDLVFSIDTDRKPINSVA